jgi:N-methylhydantoinase A/oxoprolinase/acetone carboxylase beta subunit
MSYRLGVDVGGTFTDLVLVSSDGAARIHHDQRLRSQFVISKRRPPSSQAKHEVGREESDRVDKDATAHRAADE